MKCLCISDSYDLARHHGTVESLGLQVVKQNFTTVLWRLPQAHNASMAVNGVSSPLRFYVSLQFGYWLNVNFIGNW